MLPNAIAFYVLTGLSIVGIVVMSVTGHDIKPLDTALSALIGYLVGSNKDSISALIGKK